MAYCTKEMEVDTRAVGVTTSLTESEYLCTVIKSSTLENIR